MYSIDYVLSLNKLKNKRKLDILNQNGADSDLDEEMQSESDQEDQLNSLKAIKNKPLVK